MAGAAVAGLLLVGARAGAESVEAYGVVEDVDVEGRTVTLVGRTCDVSASSELRGLRGERLVLRDLAQAKMAGQDRARFQALVSSRGCALYGLQLVDEIPE